MLIKPQPFPHSQHAISSGKTVPNFILLPHIFSHFLSCLRKENILSIPQTAFGTFLDTVRIHCFSTPFLHPTHHKELFSSNPGIFLKPLPHFVLLPFTANVSKQWRTFRAPIFWLLVITQQIEPSVFPITSNSYSFKEQIQNETVL